MPLVGTPELQWPPFSGAGSFGRWFWKDYQAGNIVQLDGLIAANPGIVFWLDTYQALGSDCCVVASDIKSPEGRILRRGEDIAALVAVVLVQRRKHRFAVHVDRVVQAHPDRVDLRERDARNHLSHLQ